MKRHAKNQDTMTKNTYTKHQTTKTQQVRQNKEAHSYKGCVNIFVFQKNDYCQYINVPIFSHTILVLCFFELMLPCVVCKSNKRFVLFNDQKHKSVETNSLFKGLN